MASVIKFDSANDPAKTDQPREFNMQDVQSKAREYLADVQKQADQILADAKAQADGITEEAKAKGIAQAQAEVTRRVNEQAQKLSDQQCKTAVGACQSTVAKIGQSSAEWLTQWRRQTIELSLSIAEKIVRKAMRENHDLLHGWLEEAIVAAKDLRELRILVNPDDFAVAGQFMQHLAKSVPQAASAEIVPDPAVESGGCVVKSVDGTIDLQLSTQLERLEEQLQ